MDEEDYPDPDAEDDDSELLDNCDDDLVDHYENHYKHNFDDSDKSDNDSDLMELELLDNGMELESFIDQEDPYPPEPLVLFNVVLFDKIARLYISLQFDFAKAMSLCILWIPNIHNLENPDVRESSYASTGLLLNHFCDRSFTGNNLVLASTHIPKRVDPSLIAPNKFNTCIKIRRLLGPQQPKHFFTLLSTRGFHLEKKLFYTHTNGFGSITMGSPIPEFVALTNEALSISITQKKSILYANLIRFARHRQTREYETEPTSFQDHGILVYRIGRAVAQNVLVSNCPIDPISIYRKQPELIADLARYRLYEWYFNLGTNMKKLMILLYLLSCSAGWVAYELWSRPGLD